MRRRKSTHEEREKEKQSFLIHGRDDCAIACPCQLSQYCRDHVLSLPFNYPSPTAPLAHSLLSISFLFYCREMRDDLQVILNEKEILAPLPAVDWKLIS